MSALGPQRTETRPQCLLSGVKQTSLPYRKMSANDPKRTSGRSLNDLCLNSHLTSQYAS